jgi:hypothetical protein
MSRDSGVASPGSGQQSSYAGQIRSSQNGLSEFLIDLSPVRGVYRKTREFDQKKSRDFA